MKTVNELRAQTGMSQSQFAELLGIPVRSLQGWETGRRTPPDYVITMMEQILQGQLLFKPLEFTVNTGDGLTNKAEKPFKEAYWDESAEAWKVKIHTMLALSAFISQHGPIAMCEEDGRFELVMGSK